MSNNLCYYKYMCQNWGSILKMIFVIVVYMVPLLQPVLPPISCICSAEKVQCSQCSSINLIKVLIFEVSITLFPSSSLVETLKFNQYHTYYTLGRCIRLKRWHLIRLVWYCHGHKIFIANWWFSSCSSRASEMLLSRSATWCSSG